jgi:hypothetical protein
MPISGRVDSSTLAFWRVGDELFSRNWTPKAGPESGGVGDHQKISNVEAHSRARHTQPPSIKLRPIVVASFS